MWEGIVILLYFLTIGYLPWLLLIISFWYLAKGLMLQEWRPLLIGFLVFLPDLIAMFFIELESPLYLFSLLPIVQVIWGIRYYRLEQRIVEEYDNRTKKEPS